MLGRNKLIQYLGKNRAIFECPAGHRRTLCVIPPRGRGRMTEAGIQVMVSWWSKSGVNMECHACKKVQQSTKRG